MSIRPVDRPAKKVTITLGKSQWVYVSVILLIVLPIVLGFVFQNQIYNAYLHEFVAPKLEQEFGFKSGKQRVKDGKVSFDVFVLESVKPGGLLAGSGFQSGDIPVGYKHGFDSGFYQYLLWSRNGEPVVISVVNLAEARKGNWQWRRLTLQYKR